MGAETAHGSQRSTGGRRPMSKPAGEHSLATGGGWLGVEFEVAAEILLNGTVTEAPRAK